MANIKKIKVVVIVGPTASGKSDLAIKIAKKISAKSTVPASGWNGAEIISADSRQVYRRLDIGTGKVKKDSIKYRVLSIKGKKRNSEYYSDGIRHHLIDVVSPKKQFTADDFKKLGEKAIKEILAKNKVPIIVGGTGFYIDVLLGRMSVAEVPPNKRLRERFDKLTVEHLFKMLKKLDPERIKTIDTKNKRRLIRALEIVMTTGKPIPRPVLSIKYKVLWLGLNPKNLKERVRIRLEERLKPSSAKATAGKQGMIEEVMNLRKQGVSWKRLDEFGLEYRQISRYLKNHTRSDLKKGSRGLTSKFKNSEYYEKLLKEIIKYSKRQMTWFKRNKDIYWIKNSAEAKKITWKFLSFPPKKSNH